MTKPELDLIKEELCNYIHRNDEAVPPCTDRIDSCITKIRVCEVIRILNKHEEEWFGVTEVNDI